MNADELRRNNLVIGKDGRIAKVGAIDWGVINGLDEDEFDPIPLDESLLLKCEGMERRHGSTYYIKKLKFDINTIGKVRFHYSGKVVYVDYLHTLQNLVWILTGEELEVKE